ncbi:hypothetical protein D3C77_148590 [compost metagenome]
MHRRHGEHSDGDGGAGHVDGGTQRNGDSVGVFRQTQLLGQRHVDRDVGGGAAGEEGGHATLFQAGQHQRIGVALDLPEHDERVDHEGDEQHAADQHHQQLGIAKQGIETCLGQGGCHQAQNAERRAADHRLDDGRHPVGQVGDQRLGAVTRVTHGDAKADGPGQDTDVVGIQQRLHRVGHHVEQQGLQYLGDATRRGDLGAAGHQMQVGGEQEAGHHGHHGCEEGPQHIEQQDRLHVGLLTLLVTDDRRHHQHEDQQRGDRLQGTDEQAAKQTRRLGPFRHEHGKEDTEYQTDQDLANQTGAVDQFYEGVLLCHQIVPVHSWCVNH